MPTESHSPNKDRPATITGARVIKAVKSYSLAANSITCRLCDRTSSNSGDMAHRYCGHCHFFHTETEYTHRDKEGMLWRFDGAHPVSLLADSVKREFGFT